MRSRQNSHHLIFMGNTTVDFDTVAAVAVSCTTNAVFLVSALIAFELLLCWPRARRYLAPRLQVAELPFPFGWLRQVWMDRYSPMELPPDCQVLIRFCELGFTFSLFGTLLDFVLLPVYATGHGGESGFDKISLSNLKQQDKESLRFWVVVVGSYLLFAVLAHLMRDEWLRFILMRDKHVRQLAQGAHGHKAAQACRSVIVEHVPPDSQSEDEVYDFFQRLFGVNSVHSCMLQRDTVLIHRVAEWRGATAWCCGGRKNRLETAAVRVQQVLRKEIRASVARTHTSPSAFQAAFAGVQERTMQVFETLQGVVFGTGSTSTAFITFYKMAHCVEAAQVVLSHNAGWKAYVAPEPRDLIWRNVPVPQSQIIARHRVAEFMCGLGLIFWNVPVAAIMLWANIEHWKQAQPLAEKIMRASPVLYSLLTDYLPILALMLLQAVLPYVFEFIVVRYENQKTKSRAQCIVMARCFGYQLASLYVTVLSASILEGLHKIIDKPRSVFDILSTLLPTKAATFITFVLARAGISLPNLLLRPAGLLFKVGTGSDVPVHCMFGSEAANAALVLVIGLSYSFIAPAILPACAVYFGLASLVYRWLFAHVYTPEFNGRGEMWYNLFTCVVLGLLLGVLSLIALSLQYGTQLQTILLALLPFLVLAWAYHCWYRIGVPSRVYSLEEAADIDNLECPFSGFDEQLYLDPVLTEDQDSLIDEQRAEVSLQEVRESPEQVPELGSS